MKRMFLILLAVMPMLCGCFDFEQSPYAQLAFDDDQAMPAEGGVKKLYVIANYPWTVSAVNAEGVTISPETGPANKEAVVDITVPPTLSETDVTYYLSCNVTSTSGKQYTTYSIVIFQKGTKVEE